MAGSLLDEAGGCLVSLSLEKTGSDDNRHRGRLRNKWSRAVKLNLIKCLAHVASGIFIVAVAFTAEPVQAAGSTKAATTLYQSYAWVAPVSKAERKAPLSQAQKRQIARNQSAKGSGTWVCSPSGFGKRASCFTRR